MFNKFIQNSDNIYNDDESEDFYYQEVSECPICHRSISPNVLYHSYCFNQKTKEYLLDTLNHCATCHQTFLASYKNTDIDNMGLAVSVSPNHPQVKHLSDKFNIISPDFVEIYSQAIHAKNMGLYRICGVGFRKSIEFIVKDYLISINPTDKQTIEKETLMQSINKINNPKIKMLAIKSTWIGNDETHYVRKHKNLDIETMEKFVEAMIYYIESELILEEAMLIN